MLAKMNPKTLLTGVAAVAITIVALFSFGVIGGDADKQQATKKEATKQTAKTANSKQSTARKSSSSANRKIVRVSRPGMKYRIVRVVEEPRIEPSGALRKSTATSGSGNKNESLAKN